MWDASTWYVAGAGGTFMRTTDGGSTWNIRNGVTGGGSSGGLTDIFDAWFFNRNVGIAVGGTGTVVKTTDGGNSFVSIPSISGLYWRHIYFVNDALGYVIDETGYFAKTTNAGATWSLSRIGGIGNDRAYDVHTLDGERLLASGDEGSVFRSVDGGATWSGPISTGGNADLFRVRWIGNDTAIVVGQNRVSPYNFLVRLTTDAGLTWEDRSPGSDAGGVYDIDVRRSGGEVKIHLTGDQDNIYTTTDYGLSWTMIAFKAPGQRYTSTYTSTDFLGLSDSLLTVGGFGRINVVFGTRKELLSSCDLKSGANVNLYDVWAESNNGKVIAVGEPTIPGQTADQILLSSDGGNSWTIIPTTNNTSSFTGICMASTAVGCIVGTGGVAMKTTTGGSSWFPLLLPTSENLMRVEFVSENVGWVMGTNGTILKTTNGGSSWISQNSGITDPITESRFLSEDLGYICTLNDLQFIASRVLKTTNGGATWDTVTTLRTPTAKIWASAFTMIDSLNGWVCGSTSFGDPVLQRTYDGGQTWATVTTPVVTIDWTDMYWKDSLHGMVIDWYGRSVRTTNGGQTWEVEVLPNGIGRDLTSTGKVFMVSSREAFAVAQNCRVYKYTRPDSSTGIGEWNPGVPQTFELSQNYPNPFNPTTTIRFAIPARGVVSLKVYDILGRVVRTLVDNEPLNGGTMTLRFDASGLASGVYLCRLIVDDKPVVAKKMILLR
jgi:photosystem II stability/assembly factor-like uncharacterized protein